MTDIKAREVALEIIAILTGYRNGKCDPDHNKFHTLHSIAAGESTFAAIDLGMAIARPIQAAIKEAVAEASRDTNATLENVKQVARDAGWDEKSFLSAWIARHLFPDTAGSDPANPETQPTSGVANE